MRSFPSARADSSVCWLRSTFPRSPACFAIVLLLVPALSVHAQTRPAALPGAEIVFLDVGQGDAILIRSDTFNVLIDAGRNEWAADLLDSIGIDHLNLLIATHNHQDHIGGMDFVVDTLPVDLFIDNGCSMDSEAQAYLDDSLRDHKVPFDAAWDTTFVFAGMAIRILPSPFQTEKCDSSQNNLSVGVLLKVGRFRALLTGDSEADELNAWMRQGVIPDVDLLKAAHHGSRNGVTPGWIQTSKPEVVIISVGEGNTYGHPHETALRYYRTGNRKVLRTDQDGTIEVCISPAGDYKVRSTLEDPNVSCGLMPSSPIAR